MRLRTPLLFLLCTAVLTGCVEEDTDHVPEGATIEQNIADGTPATDATDDFRPSVMLSGLTSCTGTIIGRGLILTSSNCGRGIADLGVTGRLNGSDWCLTSSGGPTLGACTSSQKMTFYGTTWSNTNGPLVVLQLLEHQNGVDVSGRDFNFPSGASPASWRARLANRTPTVGDVHDYYGWGESNPYGPFSTFGGGTGVKRTVALPVAFKTATNFSHYSTPYGTMCRGDKGTPAVQSSGLYDKVIGVVSAGITEPIPGTSSYCQPDGSDISATTVKNRLNWIETTIAQEYAPFSGGPKLASTSSCNKHYDSIDATYYYKCW